MDCRIAPGDSRVRPSSKGVLALSKILRHRYLPRSAVALAATAMVLLAAVPSWAGPGRSAATVSVPAAGLGAQEPTYQVQASTIKAFDETGSFKTLLSDEIFEGFVTRAAMNTTLK